MRELSKILKILTIILILFLHLSSVQAVGKELKLVVVKSKELVQYNNAYAGFVEVMNESGLHFQPKMYNLENNLRPVFEIIDEIIHDKPDLILTIGTRASQEIGFRISNLPIVFLMVLNPESQGLKKSAEYPFNNISGICLDIPVEVQFQVMKQLSSRLRKIAVLYNPKHDSVLINHARIMAEKLGANIIIGEIKTEDDIPGVLKNLRTKSDILWLAPNPHSVSYSSLKYILMYCISNMFPVIGLSKYHVKAGALYALSADYFDTGKQAGELALEIIRNGFMDHQVIITPRKSQLFINKRMAEIMGIKIPTPLLEQVKQIYE